MQANDKLITLLTIYHCHAYVHHHYIFGIIKFRYYFKQTEFYLSVERFRFDRYH
jgi:hypothetical protein